MQTAIIKEKDKRINYIDFLKVICMIGVITAHVGGSPNAVNMLRSFEVPLLVILSSILGAKSFQKYDGLGISGLIQYFFSRFKRLVIPTWIFLVLYFLIEFLVYGNWFGVKYYIASFCLTRYGIRYVWIILIYLYSAMLIPLFNKLKLSIKGSVAVCVIYCLYEVAYYFQIGANNPLVDTTVYYIIPYGLLTYLGYNYFSLNKRMRYIIIAVSFSAFLMMGGYYWLTTGSPQIVQIAKYPPRLYYLGYGIGCSFLLLLICEKFYLRIYDSKLIKYISTHLMWVYLWHILVVRVYADFGLPEVWYIKLCIVYTCSVLMVFIVNCVLDIIESKVSVGVFKYLRG